MGLPRSLSGSPGAPAQPDEHRHGQCMHRMRPGAANPQTAAQKTRLTTKRDKEGVTKLENVCALTSLSYEEPMFPRPTEENLL